MVRSAPKLLSKQMRLRSIYSFICFLMWRNLTYLRCCSLYAEACFGWLLHLLLRQGSLQSHCICTYSRLHSGRTNSGHAVARFYNIPRYIRKVLFVSICTL